MGSTSYDEARDPADATWSGASWYGPSSGEYWIINPREYADPRKHGPGYQQRARRSSIPGAGEAADEPALEFDSAADAATADATANPTATAFEPSQGQRARGTATADGERPRAAAESAESAHSAGPAARAAARWGATARPTWRPAALDEIGDRATDGGGSGMDAFSLASARRDWLGGSADDPIRRLGLALLAWPPIGLATAAAIGEVTGCATYSAACGGSDALLPWLAQAAILGPLLLLPGVARAFVGGTVGVLLALVPVTAFLLSVGAGGAPQSGVALAVLLAIAWVAGVTWAAAGGRPAFRGGGGTARGGRRGSLGDHR